MTQIVQLHYILGKDDFETKYRTDPYELVVADLIRDEWKVLVARPIDEYMLLWRPATSVRVQVTFAMCRWTPQCGNRASSIRDYPTRAPKRVPICAACNVAVNRRLGHLLALIRTEARK